MRDGYLSGDEFVALARGIFGDDQILLSFLSEVQCVDPLAPHAWAAIFWHWRETRPWIVQEAFKIRERLFWQRQSV